MKYVLILLLFTGCTSANQFSVSCPTYHKSITSFGNDQMKTLREFKCPDCGLTHSVQEGVRASRERKQIKSKPYVQDVKAFLISLATVLIIIQGGS